MYVCMYVAKGVFNEDNGLPTNDVLVVMAL